MFAGVKAMQIGDFGKSTAAWTFMIASIVAITALSLEFLLFLCGSSVMFRQANVF